MFTVFSLALARKLIKKGYLVETVEPNTQYPWLNVYKFKDSEQLREDVKQLTQNK